MPPCTLCPACLNRRINPILHPLRHRLPRLLDLLQHGLVRDPFVGVHVHHLCVVVGFVLLDPCTSGRQ